MSVNLIVVYTLQTWNELLLLVSSKTNPVLLMCRPCCT